VVRTLSSHKSSISNLEFHPFGEFFASGSTDKTIRIWDIRRKGCIQTYIGHLDQINVMRISPDGKWLASGGNDGLVKVIMRHIYNQLWDMTAGKLLHTFSLEETSISSLNFHPAEFTLAASTLPGRLLTMDLHNFSTTAELHVPAYHYQIDFSSEGQLMVISSKGLDV
jgi:katanin p80 WD40 repeat-containing subunit B1